MAPEETPLAAAAADGAGDAAIRELKTVSCASLSLLLCCAVPDACSLRARCSIREIFANKKVAATSSRLSLSLTTTDQRRRILLQRSKQLALVAVDDLQQRPTVAAS
uniref:Uncharacterized protein n=1 Tax=Oryza nivara TaxID=4536 RepID=A0A0E0IPE3_ORYNI